MMTPTPPIDTDQRYIVRHFYPGESGGGGVLPFLVTKRERWIIEQLAIAVYGFNQEVEFTDAKNEAAGQS